MAINPDIRDQAYQFFVEEAPDLLHLMEAGLLTLNQDRTTAKIHSLMRSAHSLKGGAAGVGLEAIAALAHRLENIFKALYDETLATDPTLESQLLRAYDCLRLPLMQQITTGAFDPTQALTDAEPIFSQIEALFADALAQPDSYIPSSAEMGIDLMLSIFEIDVAQGLEQIAALLDQAEDDLLSELQVQAEVFAGFAEMLNLPSFGAIAQTVQQALTLHPDYVRSIAQLALREWGQSRAAVLAGNPTGGAGPSAALVSFTAAEIHADLIYGMLEQSSDRLLERSIQPDVEGTDAALLEAKLPGSVQPDVENIEFTELTEAEQIGLPVAEPKLLEPKLLEPKLPGVEFTEVELVGSSSAGRPDAESAGSVTASDGIAVEPIADFNAEPETAQSEVAATEVASSEVIPSELEPVPWQPTASLLTEPDRSTFEAGELSFDPLSDSKLSDEFELSDESEPPDTSEIEIAQNISIQDLDVQNHPDVQNNAIYDIDIDRADDYNIIPPDQESPLETQAAIPHTESVWSGVQSEFLQTEFQDEQPLDQQNLEGLAESIGEPSLASLDDGTAALEDSRSAIDPISEAETVDASGITEAGQSDIYSDTYTETEDELLENGEEGIAPSPENLESSAIKPELPIESALPPKLAPADPEALRSNLRSIFTSAANPNPPTATGANLTVRVDSERLERMNNLVGELSISRSSLLLQNDQMQRVLRTLRSRFERFQAMVTQLQTVSDQVNRLDQIFAVPESILESGPESGPELEQSARATESSTFNFTYPAAVEFDLLEMDRYGAAHSQLQAILEDLVQLEESVDDIALFARQSNQTLEQQQYKLTQLRDELVWARMLPLSEVLNRFPRILHDLSVTYEKPVQLKLTGAEVLIDRAILEKLYDPLLHLLRNAFDHGIEPLDFRQQVGKPQQGQIEIRAFYQGNQTVIEVRDDGRGLNLASIRERVQELGWLSAEQLSVFSPDQLINFIFEPGFSTAAQVSQLSGRGFGLDVVRSQLQALRGTVSLVSLPGTGTTFTLTLPLTLTITQLIVCLVGSLPIALPTESVADILVPQPDQLRPVEPTEGQEDQWVLNWREQQIPVYPLAALLPYRCPIPEAVTSQILATFPAPKDWSAPIVVLQRDHQVFGLAIERVITEQELVIKPFGPTAAPPTYLYGCTILGDGSPVPVVDAAALIESLTSAPDDQPTPTAEWRPTGTAFPTPTQPTQTPTVLVVDDAIMMRRTLALFLEREGFRVLQAQDGQEALERLRQASVQLVVCDIEMPNMNGFEFLNVRRQQAQLAAIPVMILTSRSNEKHRWLALKLGATAYFTKPYLEQEFLSALKSVLPQTNSLASSS